jgi:hypothetical protein
MKQQIKSEPAFDNAQEIQQQVSAVVVQQQALSAPVLAEDQARVTEEELLQAKVQLAELKADITVKDSMIHAKDALLQSKELQFAELRAEIRRLQLAHPPPPPSDGVLVEVVTRTNSITSVANHAAFFSFDGEGHSEAVVVSNDGLSVSASLVPAAAAAAAAAAVVADHNREVVNISDDDGDGDDDDDDAVAWVRCSQGLPAGCGVVRWAIQLGSSQVRRVADAACDDEHSSQERKYNEHDFCVGVCGQGFCGQKWPGKQVWALHQFESRVVEDGEYGRNLYHRSCRPLCIRQDNFHAGDVLMFQLERTCGEAGVLRVGFARKLNEENSLCNITIPEEGVLYPIVRLSQKMQTYTFVPLDCVTVPVDAPPSRSPSPCRW